MRRLLAALPRGGQLAADQRAARHRLLVVTLGLHLPVLLVTGAVTGGDLGHLALELLWLPAALLLATTRRLPAAAREIVVALALLGCSAALIHLVGGSTEAHFHFFVVLPLLVLYERWAPLLSAIGFVVIHHVGLALVDPTLLFNTDEARAMPLVFVLVHAGFVLAAVGVLVGFWRFTETARTEAAAVQARADADRDRELASRRELQLATEDELRGLSDAAERVRTTASGVAALVTDLTTSARAIQEETDGSTQVAEVAATRTAAAEQLVTRLASSTSEIEDVVRFITTVADRTNLLALNATIEAARAGDAGRGFAVVAQQVKELAVQTAEATGRVASQLGAIATDSTATAEAIEEIDRTVATIADRQRRISEAVASQRVATGEAAGSTEELAATVERIADGVTGVASELARSTAGAA